MWFQELRAIGKIFYKNDVKIGDIYDEDSSPLDDSGLLVLGNRVSSGLCRRWMSNSRRQMRSSVRQKSAHTGHGL